VKKVQILMSTYNGEKFLKKQMDSLLQQDYPNLEILIRDDGSKDSTVSILKDYAEAHSNIQLLLDENRGVISSFFELVLKAAPDADYVAFCDQDDVWKPQKVSRAVSLLDKESSDVPLIYFSRLDLVDEELNVMKQSPIPPRGASLENALIQNIATGCTIVINRKMIETFKAHLPNPKKITMHDGWFYLLGTALGKVVYDEQSHLLYRQHSSNTLGMANNKFKSAMIRYRNFKKTGKDKPHTVQADEFYRLYKDELTEEQKKVIYQFLYNRQTFFKRLSYAMSTPLYRQNQRDTLLFKFLYTFDSY
jgi:glycosyltransferase involved in cell wall biosynthesis